MPKLFLLPAILICFYSCKESPQVQNSGEQFTWEPYDESRELAELEENENPRLRFKLINSKFLDKNEIWNSFADDLDGFNREKYRQLKPMILEKSIPELQKLIKDGKLTYTDLTLFYIYRIRKFESDNKMALNAIISLNPEVVQQARMLDQKPKSDIDINSVYGMPILLKDNINTENMPTTAGAIVLSENQTPRNAFIVDRLLEENALILGKTNLSEWAYYFCEGCPLGYSAVGGQTLNPYGRKIFETGGSSSGSGVAVAANYAVAAVGTETAGSILSPAGKNSVVGLKPTVGLLSRSGIVPISSTLDTPGPMTKSVIDNAILLDAMTGKDTEDKASIQSDEDYISGLVNSTLQGKRLGVIKNLLSDSLYISAIGKMEEAGAVIVEITPPEVSLEGFGTLLTADMKRDLPTYIENNAMEDISVRNIADIVAYNTEDSILRIPYGQDIFLEIEKDSTSDKELAAIRERLIKNGRKFFEVPMDRYNLDAILSIDNYHAAVAAVAKYPALGVPMGFYPDGEPGNITFISSPFQEQLLLRLGYSFEKITDARDAPVNYN
ncbi:MAG TPA: amidase family protein [Salinimicrobium sp.]|nr:amidase family protein [Salinimicrobium sp.]